jgi:hypothetical protein
MAPKPLGFYTKNVVYHLRHPWKKWRPRLGRLTGIGISFVAGWAVRQASFGTRISHDLGRILHWNSHKRESPRCQEEVCAGLLPRFARLRPLPTFEQWKKQSATCSTRSARQSTPARAPASPAPRPSQASTPVRVRAYKTPRNLDRTFPRTPDPRQSSVHRRLPVRDESAATRATAAVDRLAQPSPAPSNPRRRVCAHQ